MVELPDPDWYFEHVLARAQPGRSQLLPLGPAAQWQEWWRRQVSDVEPMRTASAQGFVLTAAQLRGLGVTRSAARAAIKRGSWLIAGRGVVAPLRVDDGEPPDWLMTRRRHALRAAAEVLTRPDHVVSGSSAAVLHGVPVLSVPRLPQLTEGKTRIAGRRAPAHVFAARLDGDAVASWFGAPVVTIARTIVDQSRHSRRSGLMAADAALRERLVEDDEVRQELDGAAGWPGVRQARRIWDIASARAESALESVVRLAVLDDGFPVPELQFPIGPFFVDLCWPERRFVVEADGEDKYQADALRREKRREHYLHVRGWRVERVMWRDVLGDWPRTSARLWRAYRAL